MESKAVGFEQLNKAYGFGLRCVDRLINFSTTQEYRPHGAAGRFG